MKQDGNVNKDLATENFTLGMQVHNLTKERDHYKEQAGMYREQYKEAIATDLRNQVICKKSKKTVLVRALTVGVIVGMIAGTAITLLLLKM